METDYLTSIKSFLEESVILEPSPTGLSPLIRPDPSIRAFVFDIYGTLLISASGDIDEAELSGSALQRAFQVAAIRIDLPITRRATLYREMLSAFRMEVRAFHAREKTPEKPFPEIDILQIWEDILLMERSRGAITFRDPLCIKCFTFVFEMLSNRIYPMPGMAKVIEQLRIEGFPLGIISNAQFYTPLIMNYFLNGTVSESETVPPFDPDLTLFSYKHRRSKPDPALFTVLEEQGALKYGLKPHEIVYVGNDMYRDVFPAARAGMRTVLFAGDRKSLRLRKDLPELSDIRPDYVITELMQLLTLLKR